MNRNKYLLKKHKDIVGQIAWDKIVTDIEAKNYSLSAIAVSTGSALGALTELLNHNNNVLTLRSRIKLLNLHSRLCPSNKSDFLMTNHK